MNLKRLKETLLTVTDQVYHYKAADPAESYIVWAEDGQAHALWADDKLQEQIFTGTIAYFTKKESDPAVEQIQEALNEAEISFRLHAIGYDEETGYIRYEWIWEEVDLGGAGWSKWA